MPWRPRGASASASEILAGALRDVLCGPGRERHDGELRRHGDARREHARIGHEEPSDPVRLAVRIDDRLPAIATHAKGSLRLIRKKERIVYAYAAVADRLIRAALRD